MTVSLEVVLIALLAIAPIQISGRLESPTGYLSLPWALG